MKEIPKAIYKKGDVVTFQCYKAIKKGTIVVVDAHGTFFQQEEPSYPLPILKETEIRHYKHTYWLDFCSLRKDDLSCIKKDVTVTFGAEKILWIRCNREGYDQTFQISDQELIELGILH